MYRSILRHAPKYIGASGFSALATLLMTKYYTAVFTPAEYGILAIYLVMFSYIKTFASLNLDSGASRIYFDYRETRRNEYVSTVFWMISAIALTVFWVGILLEEPISNWISPGTEIIYIMTLITGIASVYVTFLMRILINEERSGLVFRYTVWQTLINHFVSVVSISFFHLGVLGRMGGQGFAYIVNMMSLLRRFYRENLFKLVYIFNRSMASETFRLALPGMIVSVQNILFIYLDRVFIKHFMGNTPVGIYTLGYMLGQGLSIVYEAVSQAILPQVYTKMQVDYEGTLHRLEQFSYRYYSALMGITVVIGFLSPVIVSVFAQKSYAQASEVMPFVMAGFMMGGFYKVPSLVLGYHKVVWFYPLLSPVSFATNALFNWWLIPLYGIVGAGYASFLGLFIYSASMQFFVGKYMSRRYNRVVFVIYIFLLLLCTAIFYRMKVS